MSRSHVLALLALTSCPRVEGELLFVPDAGGCSTQSCYGCCDAEGRCQSGSSAAACGVGGAQCVACGNAPCVGGACLALDGGTCSNCLTSTDCDIEGTCVQYASDDFCADPCNDDGGCDPGEICVQATAFNGADIRTCIPTTGSCSQFAGCGACAAGTTCDFVTGHCVAAPTDGGVAGLDGGTCGTLLSPATSACCHSCTVGAGDCQANGCYGGWWCDTAAAPSCYCRKPPQTCGGGLDAGTVDAGPVLGTVAADGGTVSRLYFAVVGDTRPNNLDDSAGYPYPIISKIFEDIQGHSPRPQFVIATGDYMFASPMGTQGAVQIAKFSSVAHDFSGPVFAAMGNQECTGYTSSNCAGVTSGNNNYAAYLSGLVAPLGYAKPYYAFRVGALDQTWTAKFLILACNAWDTTQKAWLQTQLASPTTYTFIVRHEPPGSTSAPCVSESGELLETATYTMLIVGHSHTYSATPASRELLVGNGGAPSSTGYGFAIVEQTPEGFWVTEYDWSTNVPISSALFSP
jgi:hypothetical protein